MKQLEARSTAFRIAIPNPPAYTAVGAPLTLLALILPMLALGVTVLLLVSWFMHPGMYSCSHMDMTCKKIRQNLIVSVLVYRIPNSLCLWNIQLLICYSDCVFCVYIIHLLNKNFREQVHGMAVGPALAATSGGSAARERASRSRRG